MIIPNNYKEITKTWMQEVLSKYYRHKGIQVNEVNVVSLGPGSGYVGQLYRCHIVYKSAPTGTPRFVIAKFSSADTKVREYFHKSGVYEAEVRFYQNLAPRIPLNTAKCLYASINMGTGESLLILEDLSPLVSLDFKEGCTFQQAMLVVNQLAKLHVSWWNKPEIKSINYLKPHDYQSKFWHNQYSIWWSQFNERLVAILPGYKVPDKFIKLCEILDNHFSDIFSWMSESPVTLIHKDTHMNNIMFDECGTSSPALIDWQMVGYGKGVTDLSHYIVASLSPATRRKSEITITQSYWKALLKAGIKGYAYSQCYDDYLLGFYKNLYITVMLVCFLDTTSIEGQNLLKVLLPRISSFGEDHYTELVSLITDRIKSKT